ncbi:hypothetical protein OC844_001286 [Tilletia horrida]|nr:hypothetical protein OC844_001286 [Tilletia horrida]
MNLIFIGATAGCSLYAVLHLVKDALSKEEQTDDAVRPAHQAFVLARRPEEYKNILLDTHQVSPAAFERGILTIVGGDATSAADMRRLFQTAKREGGTNKKNKIDAIVTSVGAKLIFHANPLRAPSLSPPNLCTNATRALLEALRHEFPASAGGGQEQPRVVAITSNGIGKEAHAQVPFLLRGMYSWMLHEPHADKQEVETLLLRAANLPHPEFNPTPSATEPREINSLTLIRPALLTSAPASTKPVRAGATLSGAYTISRADVGRVMWEECLVGGKWAGEGILLAY